MPIELLTKDHISVIKNTLNNCKDEIRIVSPFIGLQTANLLADVIRDTNVNCTIITRFYRDDFLNHVSSLDGLKALQKSGCKLYALKNLHTKLYIFDDNTGILGSANFTMGGFKYNHELSLLIEDEKELVEQLAEYYFVLLNEIKTKGNFEINLLKIEDEIKETDRLSKDRNDRKTKYSNTCKFGAELSNDSSVLESDIIEEAMREEIDHKFDKNIWLKFVGTGDERYDVATQYKPILLNSNGKTTTSFPKNPRGMSDGDYIYLAALSWDKDGNATPMIMGRSRTKGFDINHVITNEDEKQYPWMIRYPYYVEIYDVEVLNVSVGDTISLDRLIRELGADLYPSTQGKQLTTAELKSRHYQKSHLRITATAKKYIDQLFDDIAVKNGTV